MADRKYDRKKLLRALNAQEDIDPATWDGSYTLLPETVKAYRSVTDFGRVGIQDMDLLYSMVIRTGRSSLEDKKAAVRGSHLPEQEQERLTALLDEVAEKARQGAYAYRKNGEFGLFGTCFFSFEERVSEEAARDFVQMCVEIQENPDEDDCLERVSQTFSGEWKNFSAVPLSRLLHGLKPDVFPIANQTEGTDTLFHVLWSNVRQDSTAGAYIPNVRAIREKRNRQISFRNYFVFEAMSASLDDYLLKPQEKATINLEKLDQAVASYKANFARVDEEERYKFEAIQCFQSSFQGWLEKDAADFPAILERATEKASTILSRSFFFARKTILEIAAAKPAYTRAMFQNLFAEEEPLEDRLIQFRQDAEIYHKIKGTTKLNTYQTPEASTAYLFFQYPDRYGFLMSSKFEAAAGWLEYKDVPYYKVARARAYLKMVDQIWEHIRDDAELIELHKGRLTGECYPDPNAHALAEDMVYHIYNYMVEPGKDEDSGETLEEGYYPSLEEYDPDISAETYERIFTGMLPDHRDQVTVLLYLHKMGGTATCKQMAERYGRTFQYYSSKLMQIGKAVMEKTGTEPFVPGEKDKRVTVPSISVAFLKHNKDSTYDFRLRKPAETAIASMEEKGLIGPGERMETVEMADMVDYERNIILYGPPGTGKTYQSVQYAAAILEGLDLETVAGEEYAAVASRFQGYVKEGRVVFTTFHQTYGYEEFIEGIRPVMQEAGQNGEKEIRYTVHPGVFRELCARAEKNPKERFVLIIDEINRGNISRIFGELITLIEPSKRLGKTEEQKVKLPYSGELFGVPDNVYILGTMNTADRSIALMDTALRRRFQFREMLPDPTVLNEIVIEDTGIQLSEMLIRINQRIGVLYDREHTIGHALLLKLKDNPTMECLVEVFQNGIVPLLQEYFFDDYEKIRLVLGDNQKKDEKFQFIRRRAVKTDDLFGKGTDVDAAAEFVYEIDSSAFQYPGSYIGIYQN